MGYSPPHSWFYLKKRQSMGMGLGENVYPGRTKPDDSLAGGGNTPGAGGLPPLPSGFAFVVDEQGRYYVDESGDYYVQQVP